MNPSFEVLSILVDVLGISFDSLFTSPDDQDVNLQEMIGLYRACPKPGRKLILAAIRAMTHELAEEESSYVHVLFASVNLYMLARAGGSLSSALDFCAF